MLKQGPQLLYGKPIRDKIFADIVEELPKAIASTSLKIAPGLATVMVGERLDSASYVHTKRKMAKKLGYNDFHYHYPNTISERELLAQIDLLNKKREVHGILVQLPLPKHIDELKLLYHITPDKDVDGFHPLNQGKMTLNFSSNLLAPCTPSGVMDMFRYYKIDTCGKKAVVCGRSNIVGKAMAIMLMQSSKKINRDGSESLGGDCTVTICHRHTKDLAEQCKTADIIISAVGVKNLISKGMVKEGAVVIDVGINIEKKFDKKIITGDIDFENVSKVASAITPVPGGVGPMTIAKLMQNTFLAYKNIEGLFLEKTR